jgi:hypothetical protein
MKTITLRTAEAKDAEMLADWATQNPDIPSDDIEAVAKSTPLVVVVEVDGKPEAYLPLIPALTIGYLGFRPGQDTRTKALALRGMLDGLQRVQSNLGISDAYVFTKAEYPMGKWALKNGFKQKSKDGFTLEKR